MSEGWESDTSHQCKFVVYCDHEQNTLADSIPAVSIQEIG